MKILSRLAVVTCLFVIACMSSCSKEEVVVNLNRPAGCDSSEMSYSIHIMPIISSNCAYSGCHVPGTGNYDYTRYAVLADRIRSGRLEERLLLPQSSPLHMPKSPYPVPECDLYHLRLWIHQGFKNN